MSILPWAGISFSNYLKEESYTEFYYIKRFTGWVFYKNILAGVK